MTHEFKKIVEESLLAKSRGLKSVLVSVVALNGSSYRKPGVRMLIIENGKMIGAVSGGCVEKEIVLQSQTVFNTGKAKMMTYNGRYRLGCEGILYILIEPLNLNKVFTSALSKCLNQRVPFEILSYYKKQEGVHLGLGSFMSIDSRLFPVSTSNKSEVSELQVFKQNMLPFFKLIVIGAEHDAVQLCRYASLTGWEVTIIAGIKESKSINEFPGAHTLLTTTPEFFDLSNIDNQTAIVLMTHNFAYDLRYLETLKDTNVSYVGLLGPSKRKNDLLSQLIEYCPEISDEFLELIHGPAGLNIGSETPQEIAISIVSEILAFTRKQNPLSLNQKVGRIHSKA